MKWWCTSYNISFLALSFDGVCEFHLDEIWENCIESSVNSGRGSWCHWKRNRESRERESKSLGVMILYSANCQLVPQHHWCSFITFGIIKPTTNKSRRHFVTRALRFYHFVIILRFFSLFISLLLVVSVYLSRISFFRQLVVVCVYFLQSLLFGFRVQRHRPENKNYTSSVCS